MNIFNERLQRMKFSYLMAVTQRDTAPAALFTLPLLGQPAAPAGLTPGMMPSPQRPGNASGPARPFSVPVQPTAPHAAPRVLHVRAHLLRAPATPSQPEWEPAAPAFPSAAFPTPRPVDRQQPESWPAVDASQPAALDPGFEAPTFDPDTLAQPTFMENPSGPTAGGPTDPLDPFGDLAEALAAGLTTAPPEYPQPSPQWTPDAPMAPTPVAPEPELAPAPPRMPSFTEAMALNGRLGTSAPADRTVPAPGVPPTLSEQATAATHASGPQAVPPTSNSAAPFQPQSPQQPRVTLEERLRAATAATGAAPVLAPAVQAQPTIRPEPLPQSIAPARNATEPVAETVTALAQPVSLPENQGSPEQASTPIPESAPVRAASSPESVSTPSGPMASPEKADSAGTMAEPSSEVAEAGEIVEVAPPTAPESKTASPVTPPTEADTSSNVAPATPEEDAVQQARQAEEEQKKRQELEDLMRRMNNGVPVRLPRRPRPNVPVKAEPAEPPPPPLPEIPLEVAQNFLARLNRFAEMEQSGETSESPLLYNRLEHWEDHHPENNARIEDYLDVGPPETAPTPAQAVPVAERTASSPSAPDRRTPPPPVTATNPAVSLPAAPAARLQKALEVGERHRLKAEPRTTTTSRAREGQPPSRPRPSPDADDTEGRTRAPILNRTSPDAAPVVAPPIQIRKEQVQETRPLLSVPDHETDDTTHARPEVRPTPSMASPILTPDPLEQSEPRRRTEAIPEGEGEHATEEVSLHRTASITSLVSSLPLPLGSEVSPSMPAAQDRPVENAQRLPLESSVPSGSPLIPAVDRPHAASIPVESPALPTAEAAAEQRPPQQVTALSPGPRSIESPPLAPTVLAPPEVEIAPLVVTRQTTPLISAAPVTPPAMAERGEPTQVTAEGLPSRPAFLASQIAETAPMVVTQRAAPLLPATPVAPPIRPARSSSAQVLAMPRESQPFEELPSVQAFVAPRGAEPTPKVVARQATALSPAAPVARTSVQAWHDSPVPGTATGDGAGAGQTQATLVPAPVVRQAPAPLSSTRPAGLPVQRSGLLPDPTNSGAETLPHTGTFDWSRPAQPVFSPVQRPVEQSVAVPHPAVNHAPAFLPLPGHASDQANRTGNPPFGIPTPLMLGAPDLEATRPRFGPAVPVGLPPVVPTAPSLTSPDARVWPGREIGLRPSVSPAEPPQAFPTPVWASSPWAETTAFSQPDLPGRPGPVLSLPAQPARPDLAHLGAQALQADGHGTPLPLGVQEALQRTLGTSVRDIRVVRNAQVPALLSAANADGLAVDRTVFLPPHVDLTTPAGHALAAHEFTHALRRTQPGFMPDVVRRADPAAPSLTHEEELAVLTEHLAHQEAQDAPRAPARTPSFPLTARERRTPRDMPLPRAPIMPAPTRPELAPVTPAAPARTSSPAPQVHAADTNRPAPQPPANPAPAPSKEREKDVAVGSRQSTTPQVDLDQVARDVYARLRERLGEELRRLRS